MITAGLAIDIVVVMKPKAAFIWYLLVFLLLVSHRVVM
jgi:hypothetical protein|tara:strand:+ start:755 stop:868 length:114 start_codon:yes stop_codon:yes gene_type:complete